MAYRIKVTMKMMMIMMMMITITIMITTTIFRLKWIVIGLISQRVVSFDAHEHLGLFPHQMHQSYYITSCHLISYHIISYHVISRDMITIHTYLLSHLCSGSSLREFIPNTDATTQSHTLCIFGKPTNRTVSASISPISPIKLND